MNEDRSTFKIIIFRSQIKYPAGLFHTFVDKAYTTHAVELNKWKIKRTHS